MRFEWVALKWFLNETSNTFTFDRFFIGSYLCWGALWDWRRSEWLMFCVLGWAARGKDERDLPWIIGKRFAAPQFSHKGLHSRCFMNLIILQHKLHYPIQPDSRILIIQNVLTIDNTKGKKKIIWISKGIFFGHVFFWLADNRKFIFICNSKKFAGLVRRLFDVRLFLVKVKWDGSLLQFNWIFPNLEGNGLTEVLCVELNPGEFSMQTRLNFKKVFKLLSTHFPYQS